MAAFGGVRNPNPPHVAERGVRRANAAYAVHLCLDALRANCIAVTPVTKTNAINEFKLVLRSYNADEGFEPFAQISRQVYIY